MEKIKYKDFLNKLTEYNYKNNIPGTGFFELTPLCNLDCKMCYVHLQDPSVKGRMLTGGQWIDLMEDAIQHGMIRACLSGGEAMTHPDFWDIYMYLINQGIPVHLKTNGILLNEQTIGKLKKYPPEWIDVSLYGCNPESYIEVTGVNAFEQVVININNTLEARLPLQIAITPSKYMEPWIEDVMKLADSFDVSVVISNFLIDPNENTDRQKNSFALSADEYKAIDKLKDAIFPAENIKKDEYEPDDENPYSMSPDSRKGLRCLAGRGMFCMNWDGTMSPCVSFPRSIIVAEPMKTGFEKAWEIINDGVKNYEIPEQCIDCEICARCVFCPVKHSKVAYLHQCDRDVCQYLIGIKG